MRIGLVSMLALVVWLADCKNKNPVPTSTPCESLTRLQCYASSHCFLDHLAHFRYACREKRGPCEVGIRQTDQAACESRPQCQWKPGDCYCPFAGYGETAVKDPEDQSGACDCGGGPPAMCVVR